MQAKTNINFVQNEIPLVVPFLSGYWSHGQVSTAYQITSKSTENFVQIFDKMDTEVLISDTVVTLNEGQVQQKWRKNVKLSGLYQ